MLLAAVLVVGCARAAEGAPGTRDMRVVPVRVVVDGLREPVHVVSAPSGREDRLFVVERGGRIRIAEGGRLLTRPFADLRHVVARGGLRGLLSLAFHPRYVRKGLAYVYYVGRDGAIYVAEIRTVRGYAASRRVLLRIPASRDPYAHFGGHVVFGPDGLLYVSIGDGGMPATAQDPNLLLGKIVRLRVEHPDVEPEIVAWGMRNPWRFSFTRDGSALVIGDVGADRREEIDVVPRRLFGRANLGWPWFEGTVRLAPPAPDRQGLLIEPFVQYGHARKRCYSVVGGLVYRGTLLPSLRGRYVYGDLCGGMWSVRLSGAGARRSVRTEPYSALGILTSIAESSDRELLFVGGDGSVVSPAPR
jgi:glucose/arabinose dehydrogenase